ncbi:MAG TPA: 50S ribosomal protein L25 [Acidimicrobiia bacterium]|nr:50S ribosomal protein L25 [Acidimicrobiia bacterium]
MPDDVVLVTEPRAERGSRPAGRLRRAGRVPAVVYGRGGETLAVTVPARELNHILSHGANTLITLKLDGADQLALARQVQRHPTRGELIHVDFVRVSTDVAIAADVPVHLVGEAVGVRDGGLLEQTEFSLSVEAKPQDIPTQIEIDITELGIGDQLRVADLSLPAGVTTGVDPETLVVHVTAPRGAGLEGEEGVEGEEAAAEGAPAAEAAEGGEASEGGEE